MPGDCLWLLLSRWYHLKVPVATEKRIRDGADAAMGYPRFAMLDLLKLLSGLLVGLFRSHAAREAETAFLRQQLVVLKPAYAPKGSERRAPPVEAPRKGPNLKQVSFHAQRNPLPITAGEPAPRQPASDG